MLLAHSRVKVGGGPILGMGLMGTPLHEQAVTDAAEQTRDEHGWRAANPADSLLNTVWGPTFSGGPNVQIDVSANHTAFWNGFQDSFANGWWDTQ